ncbi:hypothetical protein ACFL30_03340 [Candidatus Latescibacterota bacterium]
MSICYDNRIVAYIDILGFSSLIKESEKDSKMLDRIIIALTYLKTRESPEGWNIEKIEIEEDAQKKGVDNFRIEDKINVICFSDAIVVSVKIQNSGINEAVSTLTTNLSFIGSYLLTEGILIRGGMTYGNLIHSENGLVLGQALIDAYKIEKKLSVYPRILFSKKLLDKLNYPLKTKHDRYPYHQYLCRFDDGCVGFHQLIYFQVMQSCIEMTENKLKQNLLKAKRVIISGLDKNLDKPDVFQKYKWMKDKYNELNIEKNFKDPIRELNEGISGNNIYYSYTDEFYSKINQSNNT